MDQGGGYAAVVLAGGAGRRLAGAGKPTVTVGAVSMLDRVLAAVVDADPRVVVGPPSLAAALPDGVVRTTEDPPGGGPAAATDAGLRLVPAGIPHVALLAADLPFLTGAAIRTLRASVGPVGSLVDGALFVDRDGRRQLLCGLWRVDALRGALDALGDPSGQSIRRLVAGLRVAEVAEVTGRGDHEGPPPWYDCDTEDDLRRAREWNP